MEGITACARTAWFAHDSALEGDGFFSRSPVSGAPSASLITSPAITADGGQCVG